MNVEQLSFSFLAKPVLSVYGFWKWNLIWHSKTSNLVQIFNANPNGQTNLQMHVMLFKWKSIWRFHFQNDCPFLLFAAMWSTLNYAVIKLPILVYTIFNLFWFIGIAVGRSKWHLVHYCHLKELQCFGLCSLLWVLLWTAVRTSLKLLTHQGVLAAVGLLMKYKWLRHLFLLSIVLWLNVVVKAYQFETAKSTWLDCKHHR